MTYFTPEIEDLRIGYECEVYDQASTKLIKDIRWHRVIIDKSYTNAGETIAFNSVLKYLKKECIRVRYLDEEILIDNGWYPVDDIRFPEYVKDQFRLELLGERTIAISKNENILFCGKCRDINTLRYISKLIGL